MPALGGYAGVARCRRPPRYTVYPRVRHGALAISPSRRRGRRRARCGRNSCGYVGEDGGRLTPAQYSATWAAAVVYLYTLAAGLPLNRAYRQGIRAGGCGLPARCWSESLNGSLYPAAVQPSDGAAAGVRRGGGVEDVGSSLPRAMKAFRTGDRRPALLRDTALPRWFEGAVRHGNPPAPGRRAWSYFLPNVGGGNATAGRGGCADRWGGASVGCSTRAGRRGARNHGGARAVGRAALLLLRAAQGWLCLLRVGRAAERSPRGGYNWQPRRGRARLVLIPRAARIATVVLPFTRNGCVHKLTRAHRTQWRGRLVEIGLHLVRR